MRYASGLRALAGARVLFASAAFFICIRALPAGAQATAVPAAAPPAAPAAAAPTSPAAAPPAVEAPAQPVMEPKTGEGKPLDLTQLSLEQLMQIEIIPIN